VAADDEPFAAALWAFVSIDVVEVVSAHGAALAMASCLIALHK
jgi:hypothetical protein